MRRLSRLLVLLAALAAASREPAGALATFRPAPLYGGDVRSLVFDPAEPRRAFAGTSAGHLYRTDDGGECWRNAGVEAPFPGWVVGTLRFDPNRPGRLWAGLWGIWGGGAVAFSDDLGVTWTHPRPRRCRRAIRSTPWRRCRARSTALFVGTRTGVLVSDDAGLTWRGVSAGEPELVHVSSLHVDSPIRRTVRRRHLAARLSAATTAAPPGAASSTAWCSTPRSSR